MMNKRIFIERAVIWGAETIFRFDARKRFKKYIKPTDRLIDVGVLSSPFTKGLSNKVVAVDILPQNNEFGFSDSTLDKLKIRPNVKALVMDAQELQLDSNQFDVAIMTEVLEHIPDDSKAIFEIFRVLKSGGYLLLTVPNLERVPLELGIKSHLRHYTKQDLLRLFHNENVLYLRDRFKFNEFIWGSRFISKYNETRRRLYLYCLPFEAMQKIILTYFWLPLSEKLFQVRPGYNLIAVIQKK